MIGKLKTETNQADGLSTLVTSRLDEIKKTTATAPKKLPDIAAVNEPMYVTASTVTAISKVAGSRCNAGYKTRILVSKIELNFFRVVMPSSLELRIMLTLCLRLKVLEKKNSGPTISETILKPPIWTKSSVLNIIQGPLAGGWPNVDRGREIINNS